MAVIVGIPLAVNNSLYNTAAVIFDGRILAFIPKTAVPNYSEFYEARHFSPGFETPCYIEFPEGNQTSKIPFGTNIIFKDSSFEQPALFAVEICEDMWIPSPPSVKHSLAGALIIANLSASNEIIGKSEYRKTLVKALSGRLAAAYVYADAGPGESTTDMVFGGHNLIAENGAILKESELFNGGLIYTEIDLQKLYEDRFADEYFVDVMPAGSTPETRSVRGSNFLRLAVHRPGNGDLIIVLAVEDNLVKGAAGQSVQAMNILFGLDEKTGLDAPALVP